VAVKTTRKEISATEFKAKCLQILDNLEPEGIIVTKRGRPVAKVLPALAVANERLIGLMKDRIEITGDIFTTGAEWDAES
jgi:prevent-host-death family protein